jgi:hypothetical protein
MKHENETITLAWCDDNKVLGKFAFGLMNILVESDLPIVKVIRSTGGLVGKQRDNVMNTWYKNNTSDWILWVDSDVVLTIDKLKLLWEHADKDTHKIISGVYFISFQKEEPMMEPVPCIFKEFVDNGVSTMRPVSGISMDLEVTSFNGFEPDKLIEIAAAGFGFLLIHRSVWEEVKKICPDRSPFDGGFWSTEDIPFFRHVKDAGIQSYAHTGATVEHMKIFSYDVNYYNEFWRGVIGK